MRRKKIRRSATRARVKRQHLQKEFPPVDLTPGEIAEAQWLACVLMEPCLLTDSAPSMDDFQNPQHRALYAAFLHLRAKDQDWSGLLPLIHHLTECGYEMRQIEMLLKGVTSHGDQVDSFEQYAAIVRGRRQGCSEVTTPGGPIRSLSSLAPLEVPPNPFDDFSCADLFTEEDARQWLLPGLLTQDEPAMIAGPSKSMKTSLSVDLCGALATGGKFLGQFAATRPFRVGIMSGESGRRSLRDLAQRWSATAGVDIRDVKNLVWSFKIPNLANPSHLSHLRDWIGRHQLEVVLFDPFYLMAPAVNPTNVFAMGAMLRELASCCLDLGATPILCHHTRKSIRPRILELTDMAGAGCQEFARQWLLINRRQKYEPGSGKHRLWLAIGGSAGQGGMWGVDIEEGRPDDPQGRRWEVKLRDRKSLGDEEVEQEQVWQEQRTWGKVRAAFARVGDGPITKTMVNKRSMLSGGKFATVWDAMLEAGEIVRGETILVGNNQKAMTYLLASQVDE